MLDVLSGSVHANTMPSSAGDVGPSTSNRVDIEQERKEPGQDPDRGTAQMAVEEEEPEPFQRRIPFVGKAKRHAHFRTVTSDSEEPKQKLTWQSQLRATLFNSWVNLLLVFVPAGFALNYTIGPSLATFFINFFAILPLSIAAEYAIAELILNVGENWGGLAYITIR